MTAAPGRWAACALLAWTLTAAFGVSAQESLARIARLHALSGPALPGDVVDRRILSPKSALFNADGTKLYINALEGGQTLIYAFPSLEPLSVIDHTFRASDESLFVNGETTALGYRYFNGAPSRYNQFTGKPVEMTFSHEGRFLWIPYYRRSFDPNASSPSAVAIVDTRTDRIVRVMPTGPLPKFVAVSPDSTRAAVTHWGDNTLGVLDISGEDPAKFVYIDHWVVERRLPVEGIEGNRDVLCGFCLRGTVFTPDGRQVLVARMGGGGIAGFDTASGRYLGTVTDIVPNPRHVVVSKDGSTLYVSGNQSGLVGRYDLAAIVAALERAQGARVAGPGGATLLAGAGVRTIELSPDQRSLYAAVNNDAKLVKVDLASWRVVTRVDVDPFAVGLAVSPDGRTVVTTSQGRDGQGGRSVGIYREPAPPDAGSVSAAVR